MKQDGSTGPHPDVSRLKTWMLIIRATSMRGPAVRQAIDEIHARGCWLSPEQLTVALHRETLP